MSFFQKALKFGKTAPEWVFRTLWAFSRADRCRFAMQWGSVAGIRGETRVLCVLLLHVVSSRSEQVLPSRHHLQTSNSKQFPSFPRERSWFFFSWVYLLPMRFFFPVERLPNALANILSFGIVFWDHISARIYPNDSCKSDLRIRRLDDFFDCRYIGLLDSASCLLWTRYSEPDFQER